MIGTKRDGERRFNVHSTCRRTGSGGVIAGWCERVKLARRRVARTGSLWQVRALIIIAAFVVTCRRDLLLLRHLGIAPAI